MKGAARADCLRSKDIRTLRLEDIHWREQRIVLVQSKTQQPLELPLLAVTALAGLTLGAAGSTASRRFRGFDSRRVGQGAS